MVVNSVRKKAFEILLQANKNDSFINLLLPKTLNKTDFSVSDKALLTELVYGTTRYLGSLDRIIMEVSDRKLNKIYPDLLVLLRMGAYEILFDATPNYAVINTLVEIAKNKGRTKQAGFVNAILRKISQKDFAQWIEFIITKNSMGIVEGLALKYAFSPEIIKELYIALEQNDVELLLLLEAVNSIPQINLAIFPDKVKELDWSGLKGNKGALSPYAFILDKGINPSNLDSVNLKQARVQDEGSQIAPWLLATFPLNLSATADANWLDLCAGPGGKTALLAALAASRELKNETENIQIDAVEINPKRAKLVEESVDRKNVRVINTDGTIYTAEEKYSRVLVDAPCSGLGSLRRRTDSRWNLSSAKITDLVKIQLKLLENAINLTKPGGIIVYSTCTPVKAETIEVVEKILAKNSASVKLVDIKAFNNNWNLPVDAFLPLQQGSVIQLWTHRQGTDSMFLAILEKK